MQEIWLRLLEKTVFWETMFFFSVVTTTFLVIKLSYNGRMLINLVCIIDNYIHKAVFILVYIAGCCETPGGEFGLQCGLQCTLDIRDTFIKGHIYKGAYSLGCSVPEQ